MKAIFHFVEGGEEGSVLDLGLLNLRGVGLKSKPEIPVHETRPNISNHTRARRTLVPNFAAKGTSQYTELNGRIFQEDR